MVRVVYVKVLSCPAEAVWSVLMDMNAWPQWNTVVSVIQTTDAPAAGSVFTIHLRRGPLSKFRASIDRYEPNRQLAFHGKAGGIRMRCLLRLVPLAPLTKVQIELEYSGPMMWLNAIFGRPKSIEDLAFEWVTSIEKRITPSR